MDWMNDPFAVAFSALIVAGVIIVLGEWWNKKAFGRTMWPRKKDGTRN